MRQEFVQGKPLFTAIHPVPIQYPYLTENQEVEVAIIGGGVTGSIIAYYFSKNNIKTALLEKTRIAHGSTSITTSLLQYELDSNIKELTAYTTKENVLASYKLGIEALASLDDFVQTYGNKCNYQKRDALLYTSQMSDYSTLKEEYQLRKEAGFPVDFIEEVSNTFTFDIKAGVYSREGGAEFDPYLYTHHLLEVATQKGLSVYENTEVVNIVYTEKGVEVQTTFDHCVKAKIVILATGFDTARFSSRQFGKKTITYNIVTEPLQNEQGWPNHVLIRDNEDPYHYLRRTKDNRIIIGGEDIDFTKENNQEQVANQQYDKLERRLKELFPITKDVTIEYKYCGVFDSTKDNLGFIGPDPLQQKLWYGLGYGANGILFALLAGRMLSQLYKGETDPYLHLFQIDRFD